MITSIVFRTYIDYKAGVTANDVTYVDDILNIAYPEFKLYEDYSMFAQSPSQLSFSLRRDTWLKGTLFSTSNLQKAWSKYICLVYEDNALYFSGVIPTNSMSYDFNSNTVNITVYDFLSLLTGISNLPLTFMSEVSIDSGTWLKEPFYQSRLQSEDDIFNYIMINAEASYFDSYIYCTDPVGTVKDVLFANNLGVNPFPQMITEVESAGYTIIHTGMNFIERYGNYLNASTWGYQKVAIRGTVFGKKGDSFYLIEATRHYRINRTGSYSTLVYEANDSDAGISTGWSLKSNQGLQFPSFPEQTIVPNGIYSDEVVGGVNIGRIFYKAVFTGDVEAGFTFSIMAQQFSNIETERAVEFIRVFPDTFNSYFPNRFLNTRVILKHNPGSTSYNAIPVTDTSIFIPIYNEDNGGVGSNRTIGRSGFVVKPDGGLRFFRLRTFVSLERRKPVSLNSVMPAIAYHWHAIYIYCDINPFTQDNIMITESYSKQWDLSLGQDNYTTFVLPFAAKPTWYGVQDLTTDGLYGEPLFGVNSPYSTTAATYKENVALDYVQYYYDYSWQLIEPTGGRTKLTYKMNIESTNVILPWQDLNSNTYLKMLLSFHNIVLTFNQTTLVFDFSDRTNYGAIIAIDSDDVINYTSNLLTPEYIDFNEFGIISLPLQNKINKYYNSLYDQIRERVSLELSTITNSYSIRIGDVITLEDEDNNGYIVIRLLKINDYVTSIVGITNPAKLWTDEAGLVLTDENGNSLIFKI